MEGRGRGRYGDLGEGDVSATGGAPRAVRWGGQACMGAGGPRAVGRRGWSRAVGRRGWPWAVGRGGETYSPCWSLTRSFLRSMICSVPDFVIWPTSPVWNHRRPAESTENSSWFFLTTSASGLVSSTRSARTRKARAAVCQRCGGDVMDLERKQWVGTEWRAQPLHTAGPPMRISPRGIPMSAFSASEVR